MVMGPRGRGWRSRCCSVTVGSNNWGPRGLLTLETRCTGSMSWMSDHKHTKQGSMWFLTHTQYFRTPLARSDVKAILAVLSIVIFWYIVFIEAIFGFPCPTYHLWEILCSILSPMFVIIKPAYHWTKSARHPGPVDLFPAKKMFLGENSWRAKCDSDTDYFDVDKHQAQSLYDFAYSI